MNDSEVGEDLKELAMSLGYAWPDDDEGRWRVLKLLAGRAEYWREQVGKYSSETLREVERQKLYAHQKKRLIAQTRKVANLRRALKEFMTFQVAWLREYRSSLHDLVIAATDIRDHPGTDPHGSVGFTAIEQPKLDRLRDALDGIRAV